MNTYEATTTRRANRLAGSTSPYLLQHASNPVDWYPWDKEALDKAKKEDKPIFLSVGYSSCHWCHVMERESFENEEIAAILNEHFVPVKVDREERPDLDAIYMNAVQMMVGHGGWPMSVFLTPDLKPFFGGTYFPPEDRPGMSGFRSVLLLVARAYRERRNEVDRAAGELTAQLRRLAAGPADTADRLDPAPIRQAADALKEAFDAAWGGFGSAPKFPPTGAIALLLRHHRRTGDEAARNMATVTLDRMAAGGVYDQLGGGFHRYSVDARWLVPHFEKMLYDNALLASAYLDAYCVTGKPLYRRIARETLDYVLRVMTDAAGGFHSAQDADTDGEEGTTYLWSKSEIDDLLGAQDAALFGAYYGVSAEGHFEGRNILHTPEPDEGTAARLAPLRAKLLAARDWRPQPRKDDKVLADWNGLMISAMARGYQVLGDVRYRAAAERAAAFVLAAMRPGGNLLHAYRGGRAHIAALLDDYAFMLQAAVDLYETTFDPRWVRHAQDLADEMTGKLWDDDHGGFHASPKNAADVIVRIKSAYDGPVPSGNATAAHALLRLARLTDDGRRAEQAERILRRFLAHAERAPEVFTRLLCALDFQLGPPREIVVAGSPTDPATAELLSAVRARYLPNAVVALADPAGGTADAEAIPLLAGRTPVGGRPAAYVCERQTCKAPVTTARDLIALLENGSGNR